MPSILRSSLRTAWRAGAADLPAALSPDLGLSPPLAMAAREERIYDACHGRGSVHWARKVAGRFPDGQLYVNLRGYDTEGPAVTAEEAAGWFLVALGMAPFQLPADGQARCGLYRSVLAGRRVLVTCPARLGRTCLPAGPTP